MRPVSLPYAVTPAKQKKETGFSCCLYNKSLGVLEAATSQDKYAEQDV